MERPSVQTYFRPRKLPSRPPSKPNYETPLPRSIPHYLNRSARWSVAHSPMCLPCHPFLMLDHAQNLPAIALALVKSAGTVAFVFPHCKTVPLVSKAKLISPPAATLTTLL